jgi:transposase InsO family protein
MLSRFKAAARSLISTLIRPRADLALENLALRQQLALVTHKANTRTRPKLVDRILWVVLSRIWRRWKEALVVVKPATVVSWHRQGFRLFWRWKSRRPGRPKIDKATRALIKQMFNDNEGWGAPRIHAELLKLGVDVGERTVGRVIAELKKRGGTSPSQSWRTFLANHVPDTGALDFLVMPTATFGLLYALVIMRHDRRELVHVSATANPTARWAAQQLIEAFPYDTAPRYLIRDRDAIFGEAFQRRVRGMGIEQVLTAPRSPWQNPYVERLIGSIRRDCLNHVIVLNERHLVRILRSYQSYYNATRPHLSLLKDSPAGRTVQLPEAGAKIIAFPEVGGLHHRYERIAA